MLRFYTVKIIYPPFTLRWSCIVTLFVIANYSALGHDPVGLGLVWQPIAALGMQSAAKNVPISSHAT